MRAREVSNLRPNALRASAGAAAARLRAAGGPERFADAAEDLADTDAAPGPARRLARAA